MTRAGVIIITTINSPSVSVQRMTKLRQWYILVIGDRKTPAVWNVPGVHYLSPAAQRDLDGTVGAFAKLCPWDHYSRKNIAYLVAMRDCSPAILETDDDNVPYPKFGAGCALQVTARRSLVNEWDNVYRYFTDASIWPRGFPLELVNDSLKSTPALGAMEVITAPIQQYLADGDPDVDAVYRLTRAKTVTFAQKRVALHPGTWCPFNSQNTLWYPVAYPLLYLPAHVSFRMTDIWRSYVAQRIMHARGWPIVFHGPTVRQDRNQHDLLRDFADEVPGYLNNRSIMRRLAALRLGGGDDARSILQDMGICYEALVAGGWVPKHELPLLSAWQEAVLSVA